jgi:hypothetical protein
MLPRTFIIFVATLTFLFGCSDNEVGDVSCVQTNG